MLFLSCSASALLLGSHLQEAIQIYIYGLHGVFLMLCLVLSLSLKIRKQVYPVPLQLPLPDHPSQSPLL